MIPLFKLQGATLRYNGREVLEEISLTIRASERVALVGKSGAGKSTLLSALYQQQPRQAALIPQELGLVKNLSVFHNVYMGCLHRHPSWYNLLNLVRPIHREVEQVRARLGPLELEDKLFTPAGELSGGQQQRTAVARALHQEAPIALGDEPVSAVDERQSHTVLGTLTRAHDTVVLAMHDVTLALQYCERVIGIRDRRLVLDEPSSALQPSDLDFLYFA